MIVPSRQKRSSVVVVPALVVGILATIIVALHGWAHLRAIGLLLRIQNPQNPVMLAKIDRSPVEETMTEVPTPSGAIRARLYVPINNRSAPGMVVIHGMHHLGINEPRLVAFSRAIASSGIRVLTPELLSLTDYRVDRASIDLIGYSAESLAKNVEGKVGVLGLSFAGGLSLIAATDPRFAPYVNFVLAMGAHDDLERVSRFLVTNRIQRPDGSILETQAHEYGALILIYSHLEDFFPSADVPTAHDALRLFLWEKVEESRKVAQRLSPASQQTMELLYDHHQDTLSKQIEQVIIQHQAEMAAVSPHGKLGSLRVPILLLHGAEDSVIPPSELLWLQQDVPHKALRAALISPLFSHVDMRNKSPLMDTVRLVHFMAQIFELTDGAEPLSSTAKN